MAQASAGIHEWSELKDWADGAVDAYSSLETEHKALSSIKQLQRDIAAMTGQADANMKKLILDMQGKVARTETETASCAPSIEEVRAQLGAIEDQKARLLDDVAKLRHSKEISQASLHSLTQQIAAIKQAKATLNTDHGVNVPRVKHSLSLYASISSIRWDYDSEAVAGYVAPPGGAPVKPFHFEPRVMSDKAIADALWGSIGEAYGLAS